MFGFKKGRGPGREVFHSGQLRNGRQPTLVLSAAGTEGWDRGQN